MKKVLFILVSLTTFTVGCKKDIAITENVAVQESVQGLKAVKIENDYFVFQNLAHFINSMKELNHETYDNQMSWYASQPIETMQKSYRDMLKSYELLADESDMNKIVDFKKKNSDIAIFVETGEVSINAPIQYAQIVNRKGLLKIGNTLIQVNKDKTIYILDGDESKIEQGLRMLPSQSTANIIVADETSKTNLLRGACVGQPS